MIDRYAERAAFWGTREDYNFEGTSVADPYTKHQHIFAGARVLEIGPGAGRQFRVLQPMARKYAVADISPRVLAKPIYRRNAHCFRIRSYSTYLGGRLDVVCAWYVVHHVLPSELRDFFGFVARHLEADGAAYFNVPGEDHEHVGADDGVGTSRHAFADVERALAESGLKIVDVERRAPECVCILAKRA